MKKTINKISDLSEEVLNDDITKIKKFRKKNGVIGDVLLVTISLLIVICTFIFVKNMLLSGVGNFVTSFKNSSTESEVSAYIKYYDEAYDTAYQKAIRENAINNDVYVAVDEIREMSKYEVLSVIEDATITETNEQKAKGIYSWARYKGKGEFTVDLEQSEITVDHKNYYVSINIPHPKMTYVPLYNETDNLFYHDSRTSFYFWSKKDNNTGFNIAKEQESEANRIIYEKLINNDGYKHKADDAAIVGLTRLVKSLNSDIADKLIIDISFND